MALEQKYKMLKKRMQIIYKLSKYKYPDSHSIVYCMRQLDEIYRNSNIRWLFEDDKER